MTFRVVSFDVHGTLTTAKHVEEFWHRELPRLYGKEKGLGTEQARKEVLKEYSKVSKYDIEWYLPDHWFRRFEIAEDCRRAVRRICSKVEFHPEVPGVLERLSRRHKVVVCSASPHIFLDYDLRSVRRHFSSVFSSVSDFGIVGKPKDFYANVLKTLGVRPEEVVHAGDDVDFDRRAPSSLGISAYLIDRNGNGGLRSLEEFEKKVTGR